MGRDGKKIVISISRFIGGRGVYPIQYYLAKIGAKILKRHEIEIDYYRRNGASIGENCLICTPILGVDSWLVSIGDNSVISTEVEFVLHDYSISRIVSGKSNVYGRISIGKNCFVGARSVLMYGVKIPDNVIVAAGAVVVNSFSQSNIVIGGNPAKIIGTWDMLEHKYADKATYAYNIKEMVKENPNLLVERKCI